MVPGERAPGTVRPMHARSETDDQQPCLRIAKRRYGLAKILRLLVPDDIEKGREARTTPATGVKGAVHSKPVGGFQKTGYAVLRVARRRSRLDFGLTRAQPNLRRHHGIDLPDPLRRRRYRWTASATKIPCIRPNIYVRSVQLLTPQSGLADLPRSTLHGGGKGLRRRIASASGEATEVLQKRRLRF